MIDIIRKKVKHPLKLSSNFFMKYSFIINCFPQMYLYGLCEFPNKTHQMLRKSLLLGGLNVDIVLFFNVQLKYHQNFGLRPE